MNLKKVYRLHRELGLQLRNKTPKRRVKAKLREDRAPAIRPNDVWAMGFVHDQLATDRKLRILTVVDTFSRLSPVIDPRFSCRGEDVVATLEQACRKIGYPSAQTTTPSRIEPDLKRTPLRLRCIAGLPVRCAVAGRFAHRGPLTCWIHIRNRSIICATKPMGAKVRWPPRLDPWCRKLRFTWVAGGEVFLGIRTHKYNIYQCVVSFPRIPPAPPIPSVLARGRARASLACRAWIVFSSMLSSCESNRPFA
jgi:hypothetical protein